MHAPPPSACWFLLACPLLDCSRRINNKALHISIASIQLDLLGPAENAANILVLRAVGVAAAAAGKRRRSAPCRSEFMVAVPQIAQAMGVRRQRITRAIMAYRIRGCRKVAKVCGCMLQQYLAWAQSVCNPCMHQAGLQCCDGGWGLRGSLHECKQ